MHQLIIHEYAGCCRLGWLGLRASFGPTGLPPGWQVEVRTPAVQAALCQWMVAHGSSISATPRPGGELAMLIAAAKP